MWRFSACVVFIHTFAGRKIFEMKKLFFAIVLLLGAYCAFAVEPVEIPLWSDVTAPTSNGIDPGSENALNPDWITGVSEPTVTVYRPDNPNGITLLMCPGGGYVGLAAVHEGSGMAPDLNANGITLAVLKYRMPNGHMEVPADDARRALTILRERADELGIDPQRIGIGGASAGGHLASTVATHKVDGVEPPAFQVLYYPVISMKEGLTHQGSRDNLLGKIPAEEIVGQYSNELHVGPDTPPAIILVSANDDIVPLQNSTNYFEALIRNGVAASLHVYPDGGHGWAFKPKFTYDRPSTNELLHWLRQFER